MSAISIAAVSATLVICASISNVSYAADCSGIWSANGKQPRVGDAYTADAIVSPDKRLSVSVSDEAVELLRQNGGAASLNVHANTSFMEVIWSADSKSFAINVSEATNEGPWKTFVYVIENETPHWRTHYDFNNSAASLPKCDAKTPPNVAALAWLEGGKELLFAAEVPSLPSCKNKGEVAGFRVSTETGKVIERLSRDALKQRFAKEVGCRLQ